MRRSLGGGGRGMGGGSSGMIRNVHRAIRAGVGGAPPEPFSSSSSNTTTIAKKPKSLNKKKPNSPNTALSLSSSSGVNTDNKKDFGFSSLINFPKSASPTCGDDLDWEYVYGSIEDDEMGIDAFYDDFVFGNVPSRDEVQHAVSALQLVLGPPSYTHFSNQKRAEDTSKDESITDPIDWIEPSMNLCNSRILQTDRVYDAFHLLQTEPSVQRMVVSLSSDKAVWDAVLNNEVVKELRGSITQDNKLGQNSDEDPNNSNPIEDILSWIVINAKAKLMQLIDQITKLVNGVFKFPNDEKRVNTKDPLEEKMKASLLLSVVVLLIVVVTRARSG